MVKNKIKPVAEGGSLHSEKIGSKTGSGNEIVKNFHVLENVKFIFQQGKGI